MSQDMELIEVLWKQDVDMGFTVEALQAQSQQAQQGAAESATLTKPAPDPDPKANSSLSDLLVEPLDKVNTLDHGLGPGTHCTNESFGRLCLFLVGSG